MTTATLIEDIQDVFFPGIRPMQRVVLRTDEGEDVGCEYRWKAEAETPAPAEPEPATTSLARFGYLATSVIDATARTPEGAEPVRAAGAGPIELS